MMDNNTAICFKCRTELTIFEIEEGICFVCSARKNNANSVSFEDFFEDEPESSPRPAIKWAKVLLFAYVLILIVTLSIIWFLG